MPSVTMCSNSLCHKRDKCYRYLAIPDKYGQEYEKFHPHGSGECPQFWSISEYLPSRLRTVYEADYADLDSTENSTR